MQVRHLVWRSTQVAQGDWQATQAVPFQYGVAGLEQVIHSVLLRVQVEQSAWQLSQVRLLGCKYFPTGQEVHLTVEFSQVVQFESHAAQTDPVQYWLPVQIQFVSISTQPPGQPTAQFRQVPF